MKLYKEFFRYVIPSMLAFALSGLYGIVDGFFLGNEMGDAALAAINVAYPFVIGLRSGHNPNSSDDEHSDVKDLRITRRTVRSGK